MKFEETPYYFKLTIGSKPWYWNRDTGKYNGCLLQVSVIAGDANTEGEVNALDITKVERIIATSQITNGVIS
ncbi:hypothetical protein ACFLU4_05060 [Chloroflexota bacterium]